MNKLASSQQGFSYTNFKGNKSLFTVIFPALHTQSAFSPRPVYIFLCSKWPGPTGCQNRLAPTVHQGGVMQHFLTIFENGYLPIRSSTTNLAVRAWCMRGKVFSPKIVGTLKVIIFSENLQIPSYYFKEQSPKMLNQSRRAIGF